MGTISGTSCHLTKTAVWWQLDANLFSKSNWYIVSFIKVYLANASKALKISLVHQLL